MPEHSSVPTLTIGGFLGSGKTTLVNNLLRQANGQRIVVFVNDFGAINIDHDLIETVEEDRIALSNGCVCCSLNDDLIRSIVEFCENDRPDVFAIEASGVADPKALSSTLDALRAGGQAHLQSRIYVLDAAHFGGLGYADTEDLIDHAAASDLILINKSDLVSSDRVDKIDNLLNKSAPNVTRKATSQARVSWKDAICGSSKVNDWSNNQPRKQSGHADFASVSFEGFSPLDNSQLAALIDLLKQTCLRAKGFLPTDNTDRPTKKLQLVGQYVDLTSVNEPHLPQLVLIGRSKNLPTARVARLLQTEPCA